MDEVTAKYSASISDPTSACWAHSAGGSYFPSLMLALLRFQVVQAWYLPQTIALVMKELRVG